MCVNTLVMKYNLQSTKQINPENICNSESRYQIVIKLHGYNMFLSFALYKVPKSS